jgi:hypothetical protein
MEWAALRGEALGGHLPRWRSSTMSRIACVAPPCICQPRASPECKFIFAQALNQLSSFFPMRWLKTHRSCRFIFRQQLSRGENRFVGDSFQERLPFHRVLFVLIIGNFQMLPEECSYGAFIHFAACCGKG